MVTDCLTELVRWSVGRWSVARRFRIQWHVIIAVQRGVCVMLGRAKQLLVLVR